MKPAKIILLVALILVGGAIALGYWYVTSHGFSAREKPLAAEEWIARNLRQLSTPREAKEKTNPLEITPLILAEGRDHFADHCAICHGNDGAGNTEISKGLYPPVPDMREGWVQNLTDGELLYIIKNGIRFTGMPGWGGEDEENWKLVAFIRHLPRITKQELEYMKEINGLE